MDEQQIQSLYEFFVGEGYDINTLDSFKAALSPNSANRETLYNFFADEEFYLEHVWQDTKDYVRKKYGYKKK